MNIVGLFSSLQTGTWFMSPPHVKDRSCPTSIEPSTAWATQASEAALRPALSNTRQLRYPADLVSGDLLKRFGGRICLSENPGALWRNR